jgi:site-specific DNA-methyltransferase (adenine-specific)
MAELWKNKLYFGDNLAVLSDQVSDESVDLVYLDPPFNSAATYNVLFRERSGEESSAQITAFEDTWHWGMEAEAMYHDVVTDGGKLADLLQAFRGFLGPNDMMAYLTMMAPRLRELHRVLKPTGLLYLHCDPTASHYLKLLMDAIFGPERFRNEIIWKRSHAHSDSKQGAQHFGRVTDTLLFYGKGAESTWHPQFVPYDDEYVARDYRRTDPDGRRYRIDNLQGPGGAAKGNPYYEVMGVSRYWRYSKEKMAELVRQGRVIQTRPGAVPQYKRYLDEMQGVPVQNLWSDLPLLNNRAKESLGYPTQKPEALLERVIAASSNEGDLVLDPFCGCGTTVSVAERMHRRWIGIDITHLAISLIRHRLQTAFGSDLAPYEVLGAPTDVAGAAALAMEDRHQFEWWALGLVEARPGQDKKKGADSGVDGLIYFFDDTSGQAKKIVVQVKSGHVGATLIRDLKGVIERDKAALGVFVTLEEPTSPMEKEAASAAFYEPEYFNRKKFPRLQILTIAELLAGKEVQYPRVAPAATFKVAEPQTKQKDERKRLL